MYPDIALLDKMPGESLLTAALQQDLIFSLNNKILKTGKLLLFKKIHYCITITLHTAKRGTENFEIPIPFKAVYDYNERAFYFDYQLKTLSFKNKEIEKRLEFLKIKNTEPSQYYNKVLEIRPV